GGLRADTDGCPDRPHADCDLRRSARLRGDRSHLRYSRAQPGHFMRSSAASDAPGVLGPRPSWLRVATVLYVSAPHARPYPDAERFLERDGADRARAALYRSCGRTRPEFEEPGAGCGRANAQDG